MQNCMGCGTENKDTSEYCRECGKPLGGRPRKRTLIVLIVVGAVLVAGGITAAVVLPGRKGTAEKALERAGELLEDVGTDRSGSRSTKKELPPSIHQVGDRVDAGGLQLVVRGVEFSEGTEFARPGRGNRFLVVDLEVTNRTGAPVKVSRMIQMSIISGEGEAYDSTFFFPNPKFPDGAVEAGGNAGGKVAFEVPSDIKKPYFVFDGDTMKRGDEVAVSLQ